MERIGIALLTAILYRLGGSVDKRYRRIMLPAILMASYLLLYKALVGLLILPYGFAVMTLPVTLRGDSIPAHWYNWLWIPILGVLIGFITFNLIHAIAYSLVYTALVILSNFRLTARLFTWNRCEYAFGALLGLLL